MNPIANSTFSRWKLVVLSLFALESLSATIFTFVQPVIEGSQIRKGFSSIRILILLVLLSIVAICLFLMFEKQNKLLQKFILIPVTIQKIFLIITYMVSLALSTLVFVPFASFDPILQPYISRFYYLLIFGSIFFSQIFVVGFLINKFNDVKTGNKLSTTWIKPAVVTLIGLILIWIMISFTGVGNRQDTLGWRQLGSPLMTWQLWLAVFSGIGIVLLYYLFPKLSLNPGKQKISLIISLLIYILAVLVWNSQPVQTAYTAPRLREPNMERYPYSDSMYYSAAAESVLTGNGLLNWSVVPRPFFITILAFLTQMANGKFEVIVILQTFLLALIPVLLYLIGNSLIHPGVGCAVAIAAILREVTSIQSTSTIPVSHSRLILSDMPTLLVLLLFCWILITWLKDHPRNIIWAIFSGGVLGLMLLFRTQMIFLLPFVLLIITNQLWKKWSRLSLTSIGFVLGMVLVILPWIIRNQILTGTFAFDDQSTQTSVLLTRYQIDSSDEDGASTNNSTAILKTILSNPGFVAGFTLNHFVRNQIAVLFVMPPQSIGEDLQSLFDKTNFWKKTPLQIPFATIWQIPVLLIFLSLGIVFSVRQSGIIGCIPLIIEVAYSVSNGLARNSGGRYNLVIDWVGYFYIIAGVVGLVCWLCNTLYSRGRTGEILDSKPKINTLIGLIIGLVFLGSLIPITEKLYPERYKPSDINTYKKWIADLNLDSSIFPKILDKDSQRIITGRMLYPRFYPANEGENGSSWAAYAPLPERRMGFLVIGSDGLEQVIARMKNPPKTFTNRSDVLVIAKPATMDVRGKPVEYLDAKIIILKSNPIVVCLPNSTSLLVCQ